MSDNIPFEIQVEIIKKLPVKSLIQFRSVSKAWKSLIDSSDFIANYSGQMQHLLVSYTNSERKYVSIVDDDTFPRQKVALTINPLVNMLKYSSIIGSSYGLFCLYDIDGKDRVGPISGTDMAVLWNPSIRKAVAVVVPNVANGIYETVLGFGVCRETTDPKIVKITYVDSWNEMESISCIPRQVEVFTLSTGAWRSPYSNLPRKSVQFDYCSVVINGFLYWLVTDWTSAYTYYNLIMSFEMTSEEFREVTLPDSLSHERYYNLSVSKLRESLVVFESGVEINEPVIHVWLMEDGVPKLFTKLLTINTPPDMSLRGLRGFRKIGEPIIEIFKDRRDSTNSLVVYEPYSKHINNLGINGFATRSSSMYPYMETLLLLNKPDLMVYNDMETLKIEDDMVSSLHIG